MGFAEKHEDDSMGMAGADFGDLGGGMAVASANLPQVLARHTIEAVQGFGVIARGDQQFAE
jgi:hypothetical protein